MKHCKCEMKGFLSYLILWILRDRPMSGAEIAVELEKRRGNKPSPGTIYPALKKLRGMGLIETGRGKRYALTPAGRKELESTRRCFCETFYDMKEMLACHCMARA
jgi:PadR family transcriptional regulator PadR